MFDEIFNQGQARAHYEPYVKWVKEQGQGSLSRKQLEAESLFRRIGITFSVYGDDEGGERMIPSDPVPRILPNEDWKHLEKGLEQRVHALNLFLKDIYGEQRIVKERRIPPEEIFANAQFCVEMQGVNLPQDIYAQIAGVDLIRHSDGNYYVLEDNLRIPSGVSYMLQNRKASRRLFPELFSKYRVAPIEHYPATLLQTLRESSEQEQPVVAVLTPGPFNSAYYEHSFLAQQMGIELVEGQDLFVRADVLYMRTIHGPKKVDVLYRRIDDAFLDPLTFNPNSALGVPGLVTAVRKGNVILANALGTGVADDKSVYTYVPDMIKFYLGEEPILNNVKTYRLREAEDLAYTLENIDKLVIKETHGAGGYGMLVGPASTKAEQEDFKRRILANPQGYIAQPTLSLSTCGIWIDEDFSPRHIDLRPFVLSGKKTRIVAGGLTRVALKPGSLVVNSSQGGGTKDTWVLEDVC